MVNSHWDASSKYDVVVSGAREVTLWGRANFAFWHHELAPCGLTPVLAEDGRAELLVSSVAARFMGIAFREASISVFVGREPRSRRRDGVYLAHAFNSLRFFAWFERTWFATPYYPATVIVDAALPASLCASRPDGLLLAASMVDASGASREPLSDGSASWAGPIFLPSGKLFYGKLAGVTQVYAFEPGDMLTIQPVADTPVLQNLIDSGFQGREWHIRTNATHGRSKTMPWPQSDG